MDPLTIWLGFLVVSVVTEPRRGVDPFPGSNEEWRAWLEDSYSKIRDPAYPYKDWTWENLQIRCRQAPPVVLQDFARSSPDAMAFLREVSYSFPRGEHQRLLRLGRESDARRAAEREEAARYVSILAEGPWSDEQWMAWLQDIQGKTADPGYPYKSAAWMDLMKQIRHVPRPVLLSFSRSSPEALSFVREATSMVPVRELQPVGR